MAEWLPGRGKHGGNPQAKPRGVSVTDRWRDSGKARLVTEFPLTKRRGEPDWPVQVVRSCLEQRIRVENWSTWDHKGFKATGASSRMLDEGVNFVLQVRGWRKWGHICFFVFNRELM